MEPLKIFYSYAHEDQGLCEALKKHLRPLKRARLISDWYDRDISAGEEWEQQIDQQLTTADLIVLLISIDFIDSDYCWGKEMTKAMARHHAGEARVVPVILRHCDWEDAPFSRLQCLPLEARPILAWPNRDEAFHNVAQGIRKVIAELRAARQARSSSKAQSESVVEAAVEPVVESSRSSTAETLPPIENVHGWSAQQVKSRQEVTARVLGKPVEFQDRLRDGTKGPEMVVIPAGEFLMGSPEDEEGRDDNERQHPVTIEQPFAMGKYAVTFEEYDRFCRAVNHDKPEDSGWGRGRRPVINVSWHDAVAYAGWLSEQTGEKYRLPTEAEWEYAARAGTMTPFWFGKSINTDQANYGFSGPTVPVDEFTPNPWGLYNVHGNVWEWTCSEYDKSYDGAEKVCISKNDANIPRVLRGGSGRQTAVVARRGARRLVARRLERHPGFSSRQISKSLIFMLFTFTAQVR